MEQTDENSNTPPIMTEETDGTRDAELLRAISGHPHLAEALAAIASGAPVREVLLPLIPPEPETEATPDVAMYQSPALAALRPDHGGDSFPSFLAEPREDFWDGDW